jgi:hypothetical protein
MEAALTTRLAINADVFLAKELRTEWVGIGWQSKEPNPRPPDRDEVCN